MHFRPKTLDLVLAETKLGSSWTPKTRQEFRPNISNRLSNPLLCWRSSFDPSAFLEHRTDRLKRTMISGTPRMFAVLPWISVANGRQSADRKAREVRNVRPRCPP